MVAKTILIVEDDPVARHTLQKTLAANGFEVAVAADALGAVPQARSRHPALIVLDLGLPAGGGFTVMERLQTMPDLSATPVLVVSGQERAASEERALAAGAAAYLQKPVTPDAILDAIRRILNE